MCPTWAEHRRLLVEAIGGGDLSRPALVEAMVRGGPEVWQAVTSFYDAVILAKEEAKRLREQLAADLRLHRRTRRRSTLGLRVATSGHVRLKEPSAIAVGARFRANCLPGSWDPFKRDTAHPVSWVTEGTYLQGF